MKKEVAKKSRKSAGKKASSVPRRTPRVPLADPQPMQHVPGLGEDKFTEVVALIEAAHSRAYQAVNSELVSLYWQLDEYISQKIASAEWGDSVVDELAAALARRFPSQR